MNKVLESAHYIAEHSELVRVDHTALLAFADSFNPRNTEHWLSGSLVDFSLFSEEEKLRFLFIFNCLSFSYWGDPKWTIEYKGEKYDGAMAMVYCILRAVEEDFPILNFSYCATISEKDLQHILRGTIEIPLFTERLHILREVSMVIEEKFQGSVRNIILSAQKDTQKLLTHIVENFPSFSDMEMFKGREVYFYKRAQLFIADVYQMFNGEGLGDFQNIKELTACADYKIPQILRKLGIIEYSPVLSTRIDSMQEVPQGSRDEIEIRGNTIWVVECITREIVKKFPEILALEVNDFLWTATQKKYENDKPYHRTRTTAY